MDEFEIRGRTASSGIEILCLKEQLSTLELDKQSLEFKHQTEINALLIQKQHAMLSQATFGNGQTIENLKGEVKEIIKSKSTYGEDVPVYVGIKVEGEDDLRYIEVDLPKEF